MTQATILSNESKDKQLDTFKAHFTNQDGVKTEAGSTGIQEGKETMG